MPVVEPKLLVDQMGTFVCASVEEDAKSGKVIARGEFALCDKPTANGRVYSKKLWESNIGRLSKKMTERQVFGELDHPMDGKTKLTRVSHILTNLKIEEGKILGEAEVVDTGKGKDLKALIKAGARVGVSSRGFGSTMTDGRGLEIVGEDYRLMTFDFVADPADETAVPDIFVEDKGIKETEMAELTLDALREKNPTLVKQIEDAARQQKLDEEVTKKVTERETKLKEDFSKQLLDKIVEMKDDLREEVRGETLSDPEVGKARTVVTKMVEMLRPFMLPESAETVVEGKDGEIAALKKQVGDMTAELDGIKKEHAELEAVARKVGHQLHIEKKLAGDAMAEDIRSRLKGREFESTAKIDETIEEVRKLVAAEKEESEKATKSVKEKDEKIVQLESQLEKALMLGKQYGLMAYLERKLQGVPQAPKIRKMAESKDFTSEEEVDEFIRAVTSGAPVSEEFDRIRSRLSNRRSRTLSEGGDGGEDDVVIEDTHVQTPRGRAPSDVVAGVSMDELAKLVQPRNG